MKAKIINPKHLVILGNSKSLSNQEFLAVFLKRWGQKFGYFSLFATFPAILTSFGQNARTEDTKKPEMSAAGQNERLLKELKNKRSDLKLFRNLSNYRLPYQKGKYDFISLFAGSDNCPGAPIPGGNYTAAAPFTDTGDTTGANNTVNSVGSYYYYYSYSASGPDHIYSFKLTGLGANPRIDVSSTSATYSPMIYVLNSESERCPNGTNNILFNNFYPSAAIAGGTATLSLQGFPLNVPFYLFIDSQSNVVDGSGPYRVRMQDVNIATTTAPSTPLNVVPTSVSPSQINVNWSVNPGFELVTSYNLRVNGSNVITGITALPHAVNGLTQNTSYTFEVQAVNQFGASGWSTPVSATTLQSTPTVPTIASVTVISPTQIDVFWNQNRVNESVIDYNLRINGSTIISNITFLSYAVRNLTEDSPYTFEVQARNSLGLSPWSAPVNAKTPPDNIPPKAPPRVTPRAVSPYQINVFWDAATSNVTGHNLRINGSTVISNIQFLSYGVRNLTPNTTYTFEVQAINPFGVSPWTAPVSMTTNQLLPPLRVSPQEISPTQINVFWDASTSPNITAYNLRVNGSTVIPNITFLSYAVRDLTPATTYIFEVQAVDSFGAVSGWSNPATASTNPLLPPPRVSPRITSSTQIDVFWDASLSPNITSYNLRVNGSTVISNINFLSYAIRNLTPNTTYSFEVQAVNGNGFVSAWSTPVSATTAPPPLPPARVLPQPVSPTQINVFWDSSLSPNVVGYNLRVNGAMVIPNIGFLSYAVINLTPNTTYTFEVQTIDAGGATSNWTTPVSATTPPQTSLDGQDESIWLTQEWQMTIR